MDPESCRIFLGLVRLRSFSKAAEALHVAQSTASHRIQHLEDTLGVALFIRGRDVALTEAGRVLLPYVETLVGAEGDARAALVGYTSQVRGTVRVCASQTAGGYIVPETICSFCASFPDVQVSLRIANSEEVLRAVDDGEVDFGIVETPLSTPRLSEREWVRDDLVLVVARTHRLAGASELLPTDLRGELLALREPGSGTRDAVVQSWPDALEDTFRIIEMGSLASIRRSVLIGQAAAFLSRRVVDADLGHGEMSEVLVKGVRPTRVMRLVKRREAFASRAAGALYEAVSRAGTDLARSPR